MSRPGRFLRTLAKLRFRLLGLATIKDIPGDKFKVVVSGLEDQGWRAGARYSGFDAGIDYDAFRLRKGLVELKCEWDNWTEWSVEGPRRIVEAVARDNQLEVTHAWRWSGYDGAGRS
jgi:hypothetical protein